jgi:hypothetical protein
MALTSARSRRKWNAASLARDQIIQSVTKQARIATLGAY